MDNETFQLWYDELSSERKLDVQANILEISIWWGIPKENFTMGRVFVHAWEKASEWMQQSVRLDILRNEFEGRFRPY